jgi:Carboxypeptidase regulatory-like domain
MPLLLLLLAFVQQPQLGEIEVTVQDSVTGQAIPGADLRFIFIQTPPPNIVTQITADENGHAVFSNLAAGNYSVSATRDGYIDGGPANLFATRITIGPQPLKRTVDLKLTRGGTINGRVVDSKGRPLARAQMGLLRKTYRDGRPLLVRGGSRAQTDDRGEYRLISITPGEYFLQVELQPTLTAAQDKYPRISYYPGVVDASQAAPVRVTGPAEIAAGDFTVPDVPTFTISGKVINSVLGGRLLANGQRMRTIASFFIGARDTSGLEEPILVSNRGYSGVNDLDVTPFELTGFTAGSYYIYPIADSASTSFSSHKTPVDVTDRNIEGLSITIAPDPDMKGKISVEGDESTIRWESLRLSVRWLENLPSLVSIGVRANLQRVDPATREFTFKGVPESRFLPTITGLPPDAYISDLRQGSRNAFTDGINASGREVEEPIEIVVNTKGGTIQGTVLDAGQMPVRSAGVALVPDGIRRGNSLLYKRVTADASGHFTLRGVAPGSYKVFAWASLPEGSAEENAEFIAPFEPRGVAVNVETAAAAVNIVVPVIPR